MLRNRIGLVTLGLLLTSQILAINYQDLQVRVSMGQGQYRMDGLKALQLEIQRDVQHMGLDIKTMSSFPEFYYAEVQVFKQISDTRYAGVSYSHHETGARLHYEDYSGELRSDQVVQADMVGICNRYRLARLGPVEISANYGLSVVYSQLQTVDLIRLYDEGEEIRNNFSAVGFVIVPSVSLDYAWHRFDVHMNAGYSFNLNQSLSQDDDAESNLTADGSEIKANWSGYRIAFGIGYQLFSP